jgi:hypothetical protein
MAVARHDPAVVQGAIQVTLLVTGVMTTLGAQPVGRPGGGAGLLRLHRPRLGPRAAHPEDRRQRDRQRGVDLHRRDRPVLRARRARRVGHRGWHRTAPTPTSGAVRSACAAQGMAGSAGHREHAKPGARGGRRRRTPSGGRCGSDSCFALSRSTLVSRSHGGLRPRPAGASPSGSPPPLRPDSRPGDLLVAARRCAPRQEPTRARRQPAAEKGETQV